MPPADLASILTLLSRIEELVARVAALEAENAALRAKLDLPPKTPDNSSTPPAQGHKADTPPGRRGKGKVHPGAHRPLPPNPTRQREVMAARVAALPRGCLGGGAGRQGEP
jgi:transposase